MPDPGTEDDNFTPLTALDWQVHVYGAPAGDIAAVCAERGLALHVFDWREPMRAVGLRRNVSYLVRPDGYIGLAGANALTPRVPVILPGS